jgi:nucleosome binding factor SPN SPT16 subunit
VCTVCAFSSRIQEQQTIYRLLLTLQAEVIPMMKDGSAIRDIYQHAIAFVRKHKPELEKNFVKNIGFGVRSTLIFLSCSFN